MERKRSNFSKGLRTTAIFVAVAFVLQLAFVLFLTPQGLSHLYPYLVRMKSEEVASDASFAEYYDLRTSFADGELFFLGVNTDVAESYFVILDYLRFLKKNFDIQTVALYVTPNVAGYINSYIFAEEGEELEAAKQTLENTGMRTADFYSFVDSLRALNETLSPQRKLTVTGIYAESLENDILNSFTNKLLGGWGGFGDVIMDALSISDIESFFDYFDAHLDSFAEFLGEEEFTRYCNARDLYRAGQYADWKTSLKIAALPEGRVLCVLPNERIAPNSAFYSFIEPLGRKYYSVQTKYHNCETGSFTNQTTPLSDFELPFSSETSVRFVSEKATASFRDFYKYIANPSGSAEKAQTASAFDDLVTPNFFIVSNSPAAKYELNSGGSE